MNKQVLSHDESCMHAWERALHGCSSPGLDLADSCLSLQQAASVGTRFRWTRRLTLSPRYKGHLLLAMHDKLTRLMTKQLQLTGTTKHTSNRQPEL